MLKKIAHFFKLDRVRFEYIMIFIIALALTYLLRGCFSEKYQFIIASGNGVEGCRGNYGSLIKLVYRVRDETR